MSITVINETNYRQFPSAFPAQCRGPASPTMDCISSYRDAIAEAVQERSPEAAQELATQFVADMISAYQSYHRQGRLTDMDRLYNFLEDSLNPHSSRCLFPNIRGAVVGRNETDPQDLMVIIAFKSDAEIRGGGSVVSRQDECDIDLFTDELATIEEIQHLEELRWEDLNEFRQRTRAVFHLLFVSSPNWEDFLINSIDANYIRRQELDFELIMERTVQFQNEFESNLEDFPGNIQEEYLNAIEGGKNNQALEIALYAQRDMINEYYQEQINARTNHLSGLRERLNGGDCYIYRNGMEYDMYLDEEKPDQITIEIYNSEFSEDEPEQILVL